MYIISQYFPIIRGSSPLTLTTSKYIWRVCTYTHTSRLSTFLKKSATALRFLELFYTGVCKVMSSSFCLLVMNYSYIYQKPYYHSKANVFQQKLTCFQKSTVKINSINFCKSIYVNQLINQRYQSLQPFLNPQDAFGVKIQKDAERPW